MPLIKVTNSVKHLPWKKTSHHETNDQNQCSCKYRTQTGGLYRLLPIIDRKRARGVHDVTAMLCYHFYAMNELGLSYERLGLLGKYHPASDIDGGAMVRAHGWWKQYTLVDGGGNQGRRHRRYAEASSGATCMLQETVDKDAGTGLTSTIRRPAILPARIPSAVAIGGIAVVATNMMPHNLSEVFRQFGSAISLAGQAVRRRHRHRCSRHSLPVCR